jgi:exodeoxyribonuclease-5
VSNFNRVNNGEVYIVEGIIPVNEHSTKYMLRDADKENHTVSVVVENDTWYTEAANNPKSDVFTFGYAMTCHKSQGASIDNVLFYNENVSFFLDDQKFKYTACSRAAKRLTIAI